MIFTDRFVYVHEPKTGGTFVTSALLRLHGIRWRLWTHAISTLKPQLVYETPYGRLIYDNNKHGTCREIPLVHRSKPVLATIRNPYDLLVSQYEFGWWKRREIVKYLRRVPGFAEDYSRFPNLSFAEFVRLMNAAFGAREARSGEPLGWCTTQFIKFYFEQPDKVFELIDDEYISTGEYKSAMFDLHFLRTNELNKGLHGFLLQHGYAEENLRFIFDMQRVLPLGKGRSDAQRWEKYFNPELKRSTLR